MGPKARRNRRPHRAGLRLWLVPMAILGGTALVIFCSLYLLDHHVTGGVLGKINLDSDRALQHAHRDNKLIVFPDLYDDSFYAT